MFLFERKKFAHGDKPCYLDVYHCERYVNWMFFTVNVMLIEYFHCERYVL